MAHAGPPVEVKVSMFIVSISSVSEVLMVRLRSACTKQHSTLFLLCVSLRAEHNTCQDFTSDFYFRQTWQDQRLSFQARPGIDSLSVVCRSLLLSRWSLMTVFHATHTRTYTHTHAHAPVHVQVGAEVADRIWVPGECDEQRAAVRFNYLALFRTDTFFANEKSAYYHVATTPNTFLRIKHRGEVFRSMR